jgi:hypothetical protein
MGAAGPGQPVGLGAILGASSAFSLLQIPKMEAFFLVESTYLALAIPCFRDEFAADSPLQQRVGCEPTFGAHSIEEPKVGTSPLEATAPENAALAPGRGRSHRPLADVSVACRRSRRRDPRHIGALRQPDCGPGNNQQGANQSASAGGLGEGGNDDESQEVSEEDPGGRTRYGNHAGPGG